MAEDELSPNTSGRIIGREHERAQLRALLDHARQGQGALALVSGSAGIGKTTLVNDLIQATREEGALVLSGGCYALTSTPSYGLWEEVFRDYQPEAGMPDVPAWLRDSDSSVSAENQRTLHEELRRCLSELTATRTVVIVLEDIHWSDPASLEALRYVARQHHIPPVLIVGTLRHDEIAPNHSLYNVLPLLARESGAARLELQAFSADEIRALVRRSYRLDPEDESRLVHDLQARTAGNPFFISELLRVLETDRILVTAKDGWQLGDLDAATVPPLVRHAIESRLAQLDDEDRRLLEIAAVIGHDLSPEVWAAASGVDGAQIAGTMDRAIEANLLVPVSGPPDVSFVHALVQETLYQRLPLSQRRVLHRDVAEILADRPDPRPGTVASHFAQADDPRALDWLIRSGERALALYAAQDAADAFSRVHDLALRFSETVSIDLYRKRASAFTMLGEFDRARKDLERVLQRGRADGDRAVEWQALIDLGMLWAEQDYDRAGGYTREALQLAQDVGDSRKIAQSLNQVANWHVNRDEAPLALPIHEEALSLFEELDDRDGVATTLDLLGLAAYLSYDWSTSVRYYERAIELLRDLDDRQRLSSSLATLTLCGGNVGDDAAVPVYREATYWRECLEEALVIAREIRWPSGEAYALTTLALALGGWGEFSRALQAARAARDIADAIDHREWMVFSRFALGRIKLDILDHTEAEADLEEALALARRAGTHFMTNMTTATLASIYIATDQLDRADVLLRSAVRPDTAAGSMGLQRCQVVDVELDLARGNPEAALEVLATLSAPDSPQSARKSIPIVAKLRGDALAGQERLKEAARAYDEARDGASLFEFRTLLWKIDAARGALSRQAGRRTDAAAAQHSARETIEELAATIEDEALRQQFRSQADKWLGASRPDGQASGPAAQLSPRESEVLQHLVEGMTDREIADELSISPRTVMRHVTSILRKLDAPSRTAAATYAVRQGIV